jgi:hypothetical protein
VCFQNFPAKLIYPLSHPRRACRESRRHRPHSGHHPRVPPQRRGRPPRRESRTAAVPPTGPPRHHRRPKNHADGGNWKQTPQNPSPNFPRSSPNFPKLFPLSFLFLFYFPSYFSFFLPFLFLLFFSPFLSFLPSLSFLSFLLPPSASRAWRRCLPCAAPLLARPPSADRAGPFPHATRSPPQQQHARAHVGRLNAPCTRRTPATPRDAHRTKLTDATRHCTSRLITCRVRPRSDQVLRRGVTSPEPSRRQSRVGRRDPPCRSLRQGRRGDFCPGTDLRHL